ncbi:hypothetical protein [Streptomyces chilikensis]|uniref:Asp23/Gls24 family envelope stress response protein n=1 Tax=Streptomyces chilikensis TaxID=1194079 RepID=A0ABV3EY21_9ACTN
MTRHRRRGTVHVRFSVHETPGVTVTASPRTATGTGALAAAARGTAQRALAQAGRGHIGGRLELRAPAQAAPGPRRRRAVRRAADRAVALAVRTALRGGTADVRVRVRPPA